MLRERRGIQEIRYRERLFDILSTNVDDIFFIYNKEKDNLEYISSNLCRITGIEKEAFDLAPDYMEQLILEEDKPAYKEFQRQAGSGTSRGVDLRISFVPGEIKWMRLQLYPESVKGKVMCARLFPWSVRRKT